MPDHSRARFGLGVAGAGSAWRPVAHAEMWDAGGRHAQSMMACSPMHHSMPPVGALVSLHGLLIRPSKVVSGWPEVALPVQWSKHTGSSPCAASKWCSLRVIGRAECEAPRPTLIRSGRREEGGSVRQRGVAGCGDLREATRFHHKLRDGSPPPEA